MSRRYAVSAMAALLASCSSYGSPISPSASLATSARSLPGKTGDLLYASTLDGNVLVFTYPKGTLVHTLTGFSNPIGLCSDDKGNVFVVDLGGQDIVEFVHGGTKPVATLDDSGHDPVGCFVDPSTGNLAVSGGGIHSNANVAIFSNEQGKPTVYKDTFLSVFNWCTYDDQGDLFAEGYATGNENPNGTIVELPAGSDQLTTLSLNQEIGAGGAVQWDGKYLAVGSPRGTGRGMHGPATIYQFQISGSDAAVVNTIELTTGKGNKNAGGVEFWIQNGYIISPKNHRGGIGRWKYPAGGNPVKTYPTDGTHLGLTISSKG
jgi:hypothetical protein